jgi:hypothetical protein
MITGDFPASFSAQSATAVSKSSVGTTLLTIPAASASWALPEQQQLVRLLTRDVAIDQRHDHERERPHIDLRRAERRFLRCHDQIARERDPERPGEHVSVRGAHRRLTERADQLEQLDEAL